MSDQRYSTPNPASIYERNFERLDALLPELPRMEARHFSIGDGPCCMAVEIVERHKFTLVIRLSQALPIPLGPASTTSMTVRIYFDARVAEVLAYQHQRRFQPKYDYPNVEMLQVREKRRVNEFLGDWLESGLAQRRRQLAMV